MKPKWKVSIATMIARSHRAGFITDNTARRLWINLSKRGWRRHEPYDDTMEPEEPRLLRRSFELVLRNGAQTADDVVARLALSLPDVETLSGLPRGYLSDFAPVALRELPRSHMGEKGDPGKIIEMPLRTRMS